MTDPSLHDWFIDQILVHERALLRFLSRVWPDPSEIEDLAHETYVRIYDAARHHRPTSPRAFLFATARHLMADRVRRGRVVSIELQGDLESLNVLVDDPTPERRLGAREDLWRLAQAFQALPATCRDILWLVKVEELPQKEIAQRLSLTVKTVERRLARGMQLLTALYAQTDPLSQRQLEDDEKEPKDDPSHG